MTKRFARATTLAAAVMIVSGSIGGFPSLTVSAAAQEQADGPSTAAPSNGPGPMAIGLVRLANDPANLAPVQPLLAPTNMTYHGGAVQHGQKVFTIFWNPSGTTAFPAGYQTTINQFVKDLNGSPYYSINSQYSDGTGNISTSVTFGGTWLDTTNAIPNNPPTTGDLITEASRAIAANGWPSDANSYFQIYTPSGFGVSTGYCGFHITSNPAVGLILFPSDHLPSGTCFPPGPYPNNQAVDAAINVSSHEIAETVTDPFFGGWYYVNGGGEIGDLCNFNFGARAGDGSDVTLGGHPYLVQQLWSNAVSGCAMSYVPPSATITANGLGGVVSLPQGSSLQLAIAVNGGTPGFSNPSDLYIGVSSPFGVLWLTSLGFSTTAGAIYHGLLPSFGPTPLLNIPNVSVLPSGDYVWFIVVNGASGLVFGTVQTNILP